jgi:hypothetical protein
MADEEYVKVTKDMAYNIDKVSQSLQEIGKLQSGVLANFVDITKTSSATGQAWIAIGRFFSGTAFWKVQNKVKAVANLLQFQQKIQEKRLATESKLTDEVAKLDNNLKTVLETRAGIEAVLDGSADHETRMSVTGSKYFKVLKARHGTMGALYMLKERTLEGEKKSIKFGKELYQQRAQGIKDQLKKIDNLEEEKAIIHLLYKDAGEQAKATIKLTDQLSAATNGMLITKQNVLDMTDEQLTMAAQIMDMSKEEVILREKLAELKVEAADDDNKEAQKTLKKVEEKLAFSQKERVKIQDELSSKHGVKTKVDSEGQTEGFDSSGVTPDSFMKKFTKFAKLEKLYKMWEKRALLKKWLWDKKQALSFTGLKDFIKKGAVLMIQVFIVIGLIVLTLLFLKKSGIFDYFIKLYDLVKVVLADLWLTLKDIVTIFVEFVGTIFTFISALFDPKGKAGEAGLALMRKLGELLLKVGEFGLRIIVGFIEIAGMAIALFFTSMWKKAVEFTGGSILAVISAIVVGVALVVGAIMLASITGPYLVIAGIGALILGMMKGFGVFAEGGVTTGGMAIVGERGPELVNLPTGTRVHSNKNSQSILSGSSTNNITVNVQGRIGASDSELRDIASKVGRMISTEINRSTSTGTRV